MLKAFDSLFNGQFQGDNMIKQFLKASIMDDL